MLVDDVRVGHVARRRSTTSADAVLVMRDAGLDDLHLGGVGRGDRLVRVLDRRRRPAPVAVDLVLHEAGLGPRDGRGVASWSRSSVRLARVDPRLVGVEQPVPVGVAVRRTRAGRRCRRPAGRARGRAPTLPVLVTSYRYSAGAASGRRGRAIGVASGSSDDRDERRLVDGRCRPARTSDRRPGPREISTGGTGQRRAVGVRRLADDRRPCSGSASSTAPGHVNVHVSPGSRRSLPSTSPDRRSAGELQRVVVDPARIGRPGPPVVAPGRLSGVSRCWWPRTCT